MERDKQESKSDTTNKQTRRRTDNNRRTTSGESNRRGRHYKDGKPNLGEVTESSFLPKVNKALGNHMAIRLCNKKKRKEKHRLDGSLRELSHSG